MLAIPGPLTRPSRTASLCAKQPVQRRDPCCIGSVGLLLFFRCVSLCFFRMTCSLHVYLFRVGLCLPLTRSVGARAIAFWSAGGLEASKLAVRLLDFSGFALLSRASFADWSCGVGMLFFLVGFVFAETPDILSETCFDVA